MVSLVNEIKGCSLCSGIASVWFSARRVPWSQRVPSGHVVVRECCQIGGIIAMDARHDVLAVRPG